MNWEAITAISGMIAAAGVIVSLIYVAVQVRQNTRQSRLAAQQVLVSELGTALSMQAQNREWAALLGRGLQSLEDLDPVERTQFLSHVSHILRIYESLYFHYREGSLDPRVWQGFENAIGEVIAYPGMQETLKLRAHHLSEDFQRFLEARPGPAKPGGIFGEGLTGSGSAFPR